VAGGLDRQSWLRDNLKLPVGKWCSECGDPGHAYCSNEAGAKYTLGHPEYFGGIIGKCGYCNSLIGSAQGYCTTCERANE
jgi:hypothetical protein